MEKQMTKEKVHNIFKTSNNGGDITKAVAAYFKVTRTPNDDLIETAKKIFNSPVDIPGVSGGIGQVSPLTPGL